VFMTDMIDPGLVFVVGPLAKIMRGGSAEL
jgi:hypothetical protein